MVDFFIFSRVTECMHRSRDTKTYKLIWPKTFLKALVRFHVSADCWQLLKLSSHMSQIFPVCFLQLSLRSPCVWELSSTLLILLLSRRKSLGMTHCGGFHFRWVDKGCLCFFCFSKAKVCIHFSLAVMKRGKEERWQLCWGVVLFPRIRFVLWNF